RPRRTDASTRPSGENARSLIDSRYLLRDAGKFSPTVVLHTRICPLREPVAASPAFGASARASTYPPVGPPASIVAICVAIGGGAGTGPRPTAATEADNVTSQFHRRTHALTTYSHGVG